MKHQIYSTGRKITNHTQVTCEELNSVLSEVRGQGSGVSRVFSHSSRANLVPVLTRSTSGPLIGARLMNTARGSEASLRAPSEETCHTLQTEVKGHRGP